MAKALNDVDHQIPCRTVHSSYKCHQDSCQIDSATCLFQLLAVGYLCIQVSMHCSAKLAERAAEPHRITACHYPEKVCVADITSSNILYNSEANRQPGTAIDTKQLLTFNRPMQANNLQNAVDNATKMKTTTRIVETAHHCRRRGGCKWLHAAFRRHKAKT